MLRGPIFLFGCLLTGGLLWDFLFLLKNLAVPMIFSVWLRKEREDSLQICCIGWSWRIIFFFEEKGFFLKKKVFYLRSRFEDWRVLCWDGLLVICLLSHINSQRSRLLGKYTFLFRRPGGSVCFDEDVSSPIGFVAVPERCRLSWDVPMHWILKNFCEAGALERHLPFIIVLDWNEMGEFFFELFFSREVDMLLDKFTNVLF